MVRLSMVTIDTTDPRPLAAWWAERLGGEVVMDSDGWFCVVEAPGIPVNLGFQKVDEPTPGKNRVHLDLERRRDMSHSELVAEWVAAGAVHHGRRGEADFHWDTFEDPDGNQFCIADTH